MKKITFIISAIVAIVLPIVAAHAASILFTHDLYFGMQSSDEVSHLQEFLRDRGFFKESVTGNFFSLTREALIEFQKKEGIIPSQGYFGPRTRARFNVLSAAPTSQEGVIASLQAQIQALQAKIAELLSVSVPMSSLVATPSLSPLPTPTPVSISLPSPIPTPVSELRISGNTTQSFPDTVVSPLKLGDITIKNTTDRLGAFAQFQLAIDDAMNAPVNRGKTVIFKMRDGTTTFDALISKTNFDINRLDPPYGEQANRRILNVSFPLNIGPGETKVTSLWIENLDYVISGYLKVGLGTAYVNGGLIPQGGFIFTLTKQ